VFQQVDKVRLNNPQYGWFDKAEPGSDFWFARTAATELPSRAREPIVPPVPSVSNDSASDRAVLPFLENRKWGLVYRQGGVILQPTYKVMGAFSEKLATVWNDIGRGAIDMRGKVVPPLEFLQIGWMREGLASACREIEKCGFIDRSGTFVVQPVNKDTFVFSEGLGRVVSADGHAWFIDRTGRQVFDAARTENGFSEGLVGAWDDNERYGFKNKSGDWVIQPRFEMVRPFLQGLAPVKRGGKWEFIDTSGRVQTSSDADESSLVVPLDPLRPAMRGGKWGFTDNSGNWVIEPSFDQVLGGFLNGVAQVAVPEGVGWIDRAGKWVVKPRR
jgi:hypothetical protein